jgi:hypothetical protein
LNTDKTDTVQYDGWTVEYWIGPHGKQFHIERIHEDGDSIDESEYWSELESIYNKIFRDWRLDNE